MTVVHAVVGRIRDIRLRMAGNRNAGSSGRGRKPTTVRVATCRALTEHRRECKATYITRVGRRRVGQTWPKPRQAIRKLAARAHSLCNFSLRTQPPNQHASIAGGEAACKLQGCERGHEACHGRSTQCGTSHCGTRTRKVTQYRLEHKLGKIRPLQSGQEGRP